MQTSYSYDAKIGLPGMIADTGPKDVLSRANPVVAIPFGVAVCRGVNPDKDVKLPTSSGEAAAAIGVALMHGAIEQNSSYAVPTYAIKSAVSVMCKGRVWVKVEEDVTPASTVFVRYATGTGTQLGAFRASADTSTAVAWPGAKYRTSATAGNLVQLEVNL